MDGQDAEQARPLPRFLVGGLPLNGDTGGSEDAPRIEDLFVGGIAIVGLVIEVASRHAAGVSGPTVEGKRLVEIRGPWASSWAFSGGFGGWAGVGSAMIGG